MPRVFGTEISANRRPEQELSNETRSAIVASVEAGMSKVQVALKYNVNRSTVYDAINRFHGQHNHDSRPRAGRPTVLTARAERSLLRSVHKEPKMPFKRLIQENQLGVSRSTVQRTLRAYGLRKWLSKKKPFISKAAAEKRLKFAKEMVEFDWRNAIFSDECSYAPGSGQERPWVWREAGQQYDNNMLSTFKKGKAKAHMVWGAIGYNCRSDLLFMDRCGAKNGYNAYSYELVLEDGLRPMYEPGCVFQQDNAPIHKSGPIKEWFQQHGVWVMDWPPYSPDLNPIENVWWELKKGIEETDLDIQYMGQSEAAIVHLREVAINVWKELDQGYFRDLIDSMPRRVEAVIAAGGYQTKY